MNFVIGGRGRLGQALTSHLPAESTVTLDRSAYATWTQAGAADSVVRFFEPFAAKDRVIFVAAGVTDPKLSPDDHDRVNLILPQNIIEGASRSGIRVITFGTIMEEIVGRSAGNPYFASKLRLSEYIQDASSRSADVLHVRIHTLYGGGPPDRFMFLGQLLEAIQRQETFKMSAGTQLREYHHIDDEVRAISVLANSGITGAIDLSHGAPVRLRELATYVCDRFGCLNRLQIGAISSSSTDNYDRLFEPPLILREIGFRETLSSVVDYMKSHCADA
jgi:nucleoside-diphosphate-sugar epimerase